MRLTNHINQIQAAITSMDADGALKLFMQLEKQIERDAIDRSELAGLQSALNEVLVLAQSTCDGIGSARRQIEKIISDAGRVDVYSESGEKISRDVGGKIAWKY